MDSGMGMGTVTVTVMVTVTNQGLRSCPVHVRRSLHPRFPRGRLARTHHAAPSVLQTQTQLLLVLVGLQAAFSCLVCCANSPDGLVQSGWHCVTSLSTSRSCQNNRGCVHARKVDLVTC